MSLLALSPFNKAIHKYFITRRFHYSRCFEIFESMAKIFYPIYSIEFRKWRKPSGTSNVVLLCGGNNILLYTDSPTDIADCIVNIGSCLREISSNINAFIRGLIPRDKGWSVNRVLIKDVNRILKYLCLKHDFSFIDQGNGWTLPNDSLDLSLFFRDSLHLIENENVSLVKFIIISYNKQFMFHQILVFM